MTTTVVNVRTDKYDVYIGRGSKWGNPFHMHDQSDAERDRVCEMYEHHLINRPDLMAALPELRGKRLGCYCKPKRCHGDFLARMADQIGS